jgi:hypothetical protein
VPTLGDTDLSKDDRAFLAAFHERSLDQFSHRDHLRLAWIVMSKHGLSDGLNLMRQGIKAFAEDQGSGNRYHETLTMFWSRLVQHAVVNSPNVRDFETFLSSFPFMTDKGLPLRHWSSERLWSESARAGWIDPDLRPLI